MLKKCVVAFCICWMVLVVFTITFAMDYSITNSKLEYQDENRAIISFTFNNKADEYYSELYYIPSLENIILENGISYTEKYTSFEPVLFEIGFKESKTLKYDVIFPKNLPEGEYIVSVDFYEKTKPISEYSTLIWLNKFIPSIQTEISTITDFDDECIVVDNKAYGALSGPTANSKSTIQAQLNIELIANQKKSITPKISVHKRNALGDKLIEKYGKTFELEPSKKTEIFIDIPLQTKPNSYYVSIKLYDEELNQISKKYEFQYVYAGISANITSLYIDSDKKLNIGLIGPADGSVLENCEIIYNLYDMNDKLIKSETEIVTLDVYEKKIQISLSDIKEEKINVKTIIKYKDKEINSFSKLLELGALEGKSISFSDLVGTKYEKAVELLNGLNILNGYPDGTFRPEASITRAEFTVIVDKLAKLEIKEEENLFSDLEGCWAKSYILTAAKNKLLSGYPDGTFRPDNVVTYSEALTILLNMLGYRDEIGASSFEWPNNYINKAQDIKLIENVEINDYSKHANRGDVALLTLNAYLMIH